MDDDAQVFEFVGGPLDGARFRLTPSGKFKFTPADFLVVKKRPDLPWSHYRRREGTTFYDYTGHDGR